MRGAQSGPLQKMLDELDSKVLIHATVEQKLADFLEYLSETGNIGEAARHAQLSRKQVHQARRDPNFARLFEEAHDLGVQAIEDEAVSRATKGTIEPVYWKGRRVGTLRKKSDLLLMLILKAKRPELYRDNYSAPPQSPADEALESPREVIAGRLARIAARKREGPDT